MPQYIPPSEEAFPPPSALMSVPAAANTAASATHAMAFPIHPAHVPALPPSPGGGLVAGVHPHFHARDGSFDSPASGGGGFTPDAAVLAPPQAMVLPPPYEQQQQQQPGRFSPPTLQVVPVEDVGGGVVSPMYGQQGQGPSSSGGFLPNGTVGGGSDEGEAFEALMNAIRWQVEYYFSADNLVTDSYLRGLMDPEGFVAVSKVRTTAWEKHEIRGLVAKKTSWWCLVSVASNVQVEHGEFLLVVFLFFWRIGNRCCRCCSGCLKLALQRSWSGAGDPRVKIFVAMSTASYVGAMLLVDVHQTFPSVQLLFSPDLPSSQIIVFNRVRSMTSDPTLVVAAMRRSNELEILEQVMMNKNLSCLPLCALFLGDFSCPLLVCGRRKRREVLIDVDFSPARRHETIWEATSSNDALCVDC